MGQVQPTRFASRGVQAIVMNTAYAPGRNELRESGDEVRGVPEGDVLLEVGVVVGVVEDPSARAVIGEFLQRQGSPGDVLSETSPGFVILPSRRTELSTEKPECLQHKRVSANCCVMRPSFRKRPIVRRRKHSARRAVSWTGRW